ncbi:three-helix bundle dimerization domain-containing protein [Nocardia sp. GCM10030253]|uniref:three-helix bundle dimerization domain-containing protein n=1 Tax=Nocardia sp. GCM10030253 TaxID=3273404 RepID=UPI00363A30EF
MTEGPAAPHPLPDPSIDQEAALQTAAYRLAREFDGVPDDAINQCLHSAYDHVAGPATVDNFLPLLAERYTREWLRAMTDEISSTRPAAVVHRSGRTRI